MNIYSVQFSVVRNLLPVVVDVEADVDGDIVAINKVESNGQWILLGDNEFNAARCLILDKIYKNQGWSKRAKNLFRIATKFP